MKLQRFFVADNLVVIFNNKIDEHFFLSQDDSLIHQLKNVFRKQVGDQIILLDNSGWQFLAVITELDKDHLKCQLINSELVKNLPKSKLILLMSLIKKDNFELVVQKATELGVSEIIPVISERSEKKGINLERVEKIIREASEQSERGVVPQIKAPMELRQAVSYIQGQNIPAVVFHTGQTRIEWSKFDHLDALAIFIGPEGGYGDLDLQVFIQNQIPVYTLGNQILRAETAAMAVLAKLLL